MGQKVDPRGLRIGIIKTWNSKWFAQGNDYLNNFHEDLKIKEYIKKNYYHAGISRIFIERNSLTELTVIIETAKAGILIGRKGQEIEALKAKLEKLTGKKVNTKALEIKKNYYHAGISRIFIERNSLTELTVIIETAKAGILIGRKGQEIEALKAKLEKLTGKKVNTKALEIKNPNKDAQLVAESIATSIEKRVAYKRAVQQAMQRAEKSGVKGIKVKVSGRLNGAEIARSEWTLSGRVPLHTLRADIDYATATANTTYGALGIKVWIFNGEVLPTTKEGGNE